MYLYAKRYSNRSFSDTHSTQSRANTDSPELVSDWVSCENGIIRDSSDWVSYEYGFTRGSSDWVSYEYGITRGSSDWVPYEYGITRGSSDSMS